MANKGLIGVGVIGALSVVGALAVRTSTSQEATASVPSLTLRAPIIVAHPPPAPRSVDVVCGAGWEVDRRRMLPPTTKHLENGDDQITRTLHTERVKLQNGQMQVATGSNPKCVGAPCVKGVGIVDHRLQAPKECCVDACKRDWECGFGACESACGKCDSKSRCVGHKCVAFQTLSKP